MAMTRCGGSKGWSGQNFVALPQFQSQQGPMPPKMMHHVVPLGPVGGLAGHPVLAFARAAFGVEDVGFDVMGKKIFRIARGGAVDGGFGGAGLAGFLMGKGPEGFEAFPEGFEAFPDSKHS